MGAYDMNRGLICLDSGSLDCAARLVGRVADFNLALEGGHLFRLNLLDAGSFFLAHSALISRLGQHISIGIAGRV